MTVIGAGDVDAAAAAGVLPVGPRDLVTPLARDRARELGVQIVLRTPGTTAALAGDAAGPGSSAGALPVPFLAAPPPPVRPPSGALFRRGAPLPAAVRSTAADPAS